MNKFIQTLEKPEKDICIYGLCDPDTNELKYIGQTIQGRTLSKIDRRV